MSPAPARDNPILATGTSALSGIVVTDEAAPHPIRRASVRIGGADAAGGQLVVTDDSGRFAFRNLAQGRYTLTASKQGFISSSYGAKRPEGPGSAIGVGAGEQVGNVTLKMLRGAVITGTVRTDAGEPVMDATVSVMRYGFAYQTGERQLQSVRGGLGTRTDDRGAYRIFGLPPGDYFVVVTQGITIGSNLDVHRVTRAEAQWAAQQIQSPMNSSSPAPTTPPPTPGPNVTYAPVFYPGVTTESSATKLTIGAGEERAGIDIPLLSVPTAKLEGTVTMPDGPAPTNLQVNLIAHDRIEGLPFSGFNTAPQVRDGKFTFTGLMPGAYSVTVRVRPGPPIGQRGGAPATPAMLALFALAEVNISGSDTAVSLMLQPGVTVSGRVAFEGDTLKPPANLAQMRLSLNAVLTGRGAAIGVPPASVDATGTFTFTGVTPGRYRIFGGVPGSTAASGWQPKSAFIGGRDAFDVPLEVGSTDVGGLVVTYTDRPTELAGTIQDAAGRAAPDYWIIVFPSDKTFWAPQSRRIQAKRPSNDGRFSFPNLPPGQYLVAAVTDVEQGEWYDAEFLRRIIPAALTVSLAEGEKKTQDLKIASR